jgi:hypothetical protein
VRVLPCEGKHEYHKGTPPFPSIVTSLERGYG